MDSLLGGILGGGNRLRRSVKQLITNPTGFLRESGEDIKTARDQADAAFYQDFGKTRNPSIAAADPAFVAEQADKYKEGLLSSMEPAGLGTIGNPATLYGKQVANKSIHAAKEYIKKLKKDNPNITEAEIRTAVWKHTGKLSKEPDSQIKPVVPLPASAGKDQWAGEIPDYVDLSLLPAPGQTGMLGQLPGLGSVNLALSGPARAAGKLPLRYDDLGSSFGSVHGSPIDGTPYKVEVNTMVPTDKALEDTVAHEGGQHVTSMLTNWFRGGSRSEFKLADPAVRDLARKRSEALMEMARVVKQAEDAGVHPQDFIDLNGLSPALKEYSSTFGVPPNDIYDTMKDVAQTSPRGNESPRGMLNAGAYIEKLIERGAKLEQRYRTQASPANQAIIDKKIGKEAASWWNYGNLADEAFARATGARVNKDMDFRIENPFFDSNFMGFRDHKGDDVWVPTLDELTYELNNPLSPRL